MSEQPELYHRLGRIERKVDELTRGLKIRGFRAEGIHGRFGSKQTPPSPT